MKRLTLAAVPALLPMLTGFVFQSNDVEMLFFIALAACLFPFVLILIIFFLHHEHVQTKKRLEARIDTLTAIYKAVPEMVFCKDTDGAYTSCNDCFEGLTGQTEAQIIGKTAVEIYPPDIAMVTTIMETDRQAMQGNGPLVTNQWLPYPDGTRRLISITKVPLVQNGVVTGLVNIARDITDHTLAEEKAREASRVKSAFLAHMSHEIRTPMNAIIGMTEVLLRDTLSKQARENALIIRQASTNLLSIINDILDFSKIEAGKLTIVPEEYLFSSLVYDVVNIIRMRTVKKPVTFVVNIDCNIPGRLIGDAIRIRQILLNICSNAVKYTNEGFISLNIGCDVRDDVALLKIEVADSGVGIKEELLGKLFEEFVQIDPEKNKVIEGTGLGLAITKSLCSAMDGEVSVESVYGTGSTFTVMLPQRFTRAEKFAQVENPEQKQVLVYEPRSICAESITRTLANLGVDGAVVSNRSDFFGELTKRPYPFVFAPYFLLEVVETALEELGLHPKLVLLTELGEIASSKKVRTITTPVYSLPISNILNDLEANEYHGDGEKYSSFIAPSARILIVDDLNTNLKVIEGLVAPYKMQIDTCNTGLDAIHMVKKYPYDIVFMDHMMPGMDGIEATGKIRALEDENGYYARLPIIALTANVVSGMKEIYLKSGLDDLLAKPVEPSKLYAMLEKWIPSEKFESTAIEAVEAPEAEFIEIEGVDLATGLSLNGGKIENYLETLVVFHKEGLGKANEIRACLKNNDIKQYTTHVHALKSAFMTIGAKKLSHLAQALEIAGRSDAVTFLMENTEPFLAEMETLLENINHALNEIHSSSDNTEENTLDSFKEELYALKTALHEMDAGEINRNIAVLSCNIRGKKSRETIKKLSQLILEFEYEEASNLIDGLL